MTLTIEVTEQDIKDGVKGSCMDCPLAIAINRAILENNRDDVCVRADRVTYFSGRNGGKLVWHHAFLPSEAETFRFNFDWRHEVKPIKFELTFND